MPRHEIKKHGAETISIAIEKNEYQGRIGVDIREYIKNPKPDTYSGGYEVGLENPKRKLERLQESS